MTAPLVDQAARLFALARANGWRASLGISSSGLWHSELWVEGGAAKQGALAKRLYIRRGKHGASLPQLLSDLYKEVAAVEPTAADVAVAEALIELIEQGENCGKKVGLFLAYTYVRGEARYGGSRKHFDGVQLSPDKAFLSWAEKLSGKSQAAPAA